MIPRYDKPLLEKLLKSSTIDVAQARVMAALPFIYIPTPEEFFDSEWAAFSTFERSVNDYKDFIHEKILLDNFCVYSAEFKIYSMVRVVGRHSYEVMYVKPHLSAANKQTPIKVSFHLDENGVPHVDTVHIGRIEQPESMEQYDTCKYTQREILTNGVKPVLYLLIWMRFNHRNKQLLMEGRRLSGQEVLDIALPLQPIHSITFGSVCLFLPELPKEINDSTNKHNQLVIPERVVIGKRRSSCAVTYTNERYKNSPLFGKYRGGYRRASYPIGLPMEQEAYGWHYRIVSETVRIKDKNFIKCLPPTVTTSNNKRKPRKLPAVIIGEGDQALIRFEESYRRNPIMLRYDI